MLRELLSGFDYVAARDAKVLIVGSMPGFKSLQEQAYYAHPRNAFWPIINQLLQMQLSEKNLLEMPFEQRYQVLKKNNIALWDVLGHCQRTGSLDAAIDRQSMRINNFVDFFAEHQQITHIFCNGGLAYRVFNKEVYQVLHLQQALYSLPSTSPAHARLTIAKKYEAWKLFWDKSAHII